jgi:tryptophan-rich sensory protein
MGIGAARIYMSAESSRRKWGLNLFVIQLIVNFFWPLIFFNA